ncbi:TrbI/VirB10 family protein [Rhodanobacter sp. C01]|uniref:TrbI/VirB10 family protein n=1 Tax=Rhodanobacter sp. C01 TaxID=1945856 RepID=UPI0009849DF8|nr:TrbI/VirB10 family protein [Rhodanobacter sp. C01]OOG47810.1 hypothetical protein B0E50_10175 [Rhodanobacter sp. C01]
MSTNTPNHPGDGTDPLANNPYSTQYQRSAAPDLDAAAPQLRSNDLRRMNQRALLLLGAVVVLLLFVAYWMISSAGKRSEAPKPREEKVTVAEAPRPVPLPPLPQRQPEPIPLAQQPLPPLPTQTPPPAPTPQVSREASLLQRRIVSDDAAAVGQQEAPTAQPSQQAKGPQVAGIDASNITSAQPLTHPDTLMQRGTYIRCVLETHIVSDVPGFTTCLVTEPVYSFNGHRLLLPKGSKILGSYQRDGDVATARRVGVVWDRIITPTGIDVNMASPGIDNLGGAGLPGHYDAHWPQRISSALLISMLSDAFKYEAAEHGPKSTTITNGVVTQEPFESNTAQTVQNLSNQAVAASANRLPTITINQGTIIYVYVAKDVDFSGVVARFGS